MDQFNWRNLFKDVTSLESLELLIQKSQKEKITFYVGIDPTANDLHIGHLLPFMAVKLISEAFNFKPIFVLGGFTATIGDPSGKNMERELLDLDSISKNVLDIKKRIEYITTKLEIKDYIIVNNLDFYQINIVDFYRIYGKNFNLNHMLAKDMVKKRLESGISYTEFSYQIFQAIDFYSLNRDHNTKLQIGGSDQWGNIVSGIELIKKMNQDQQDVIGITTNLLLDQNGNKIGKSEGKPLWVNEDKISAYEFYQYFLNLSDELASELLTKLTLINESSYEEVKNNHQKDPSKRFFQNELAKLFITTFYSKESYNRAYDISQALFKNDYKLLNESDLKILTNQLSTFKLEDNNVSLIEKLIEFGILKSKREANEFIQSGAIKVNGFSIEDLDIKATALSSYIINSSKYFIVDLGKKKKIILVLK